MNEFVKGTETFFTALADRTRLRLLNLMREGEICVCYFTAALDEPQPKISRHLAYLRQAGLVETTRIGKWIYYRIAEPKDEYASAVLRATTDWLANDNQMQEDRARLLQISCCETEQMPIAIQRAPRSVVFDQADISSKGREERKSLQPELADYLL